MATPTVSITSPAPGSSVVLLPPNMVPRCDVTATSGDSQVMMVRGKAYCPGQPIPVDPPSDAVNFMKDTANASHWYATNLISACAGSTAKQCTIKVWAYFGAGGSPISASISFIGASGGQGTMACV